MRRRLRPRRSPPRHAAADILKALLIDDLEIESSLLIYICIRLRTYNNEMNFNIIVAIESFNVFFLELYSNSFPKTRRDL